MSYNGWTNYETWRVNLEVFDGWDSDCLDPDEARSIAEEYYLDGLECNDLAFGVVAMFLSAVDWRSIASHYQEENA